MKTQQQQQAVQNFLSTMDMGLSMNVQLVNLFLDSRAYKWPKHVQDEIKAGILKAYGRKG